MKKPHLQPLHNPQSLLTYSANGADVDTTIVNGQVLMRHGQLLTINEDELLKQVSSRAKRIVDGI